MASPFEVELYEDEQGTVPFRLWLDELARSNPRAVAKALYLAQLLEDQGDGLKRPLAASVDGPVWELRGQSGTDPVRVYYFRSGKHTFMIVCGELKKRNASGIDLIRLTRRVHDEVMGKGERRG